MVGTAALARPAWVSDEMFPFESRFSTEEAPERVVALLREFVR